MQSEWQKREQALEWKYAFEEEQQFVTMTRSLRLLAAWAADLIGTKDKRAYEEVIIDQELTRKGGKTAIDRITQDFHSAGIPALGTEIADQFRDILVKVAEEMRKA